MVRAQGGGIRCRHYTCLEKRKFVLVVDREKGMGLSEREACKLVGISTGSYYTWKQAGKKLAKTRWQR